MSTSKCVKRLTGLALRLCFATNAKVRQFFDYHIEPLGERTGSESPRATIGRFDRPPRISPWFRYGQARPEDFFRMLHAALIGFPSTGKSTLFQLMTSAKDAPRGKGDTAIGISKVPDVRLEKLTAIFNPKKTVPATIEFTDIVAPGRSGAAALVGVAGSQNADAL